MKQLIYIVLTLILTNCMPAEKELLNQTDLKNYSWFKEHYDAHQLNDSIIKQLRKIGDLNDLFYVDIYMGSWCHDSQVQVPKFIKVINSMGFNNYRVLNLDENKRSQAGYEQGQDIQKVPTFVIRKTKNMRSEVGRIIETPKTTIEEDLLELIGQKNS